MGLASRRRYRWTRGRVSDYWDEVFTTDGLDGRARPRRRVRLHRLASAPAGRPGCATSSAPSQADQDAIIRAGSRGALVVDGGPGTGKTVVALHRTAYLLYSDPRLGHRRGGVLFVGPHEPYLAYVSDVLPSLGEEGVQTCTLRDLVPEGATAPPETDPEVARLKSVDGPRRRHRARGRRSTRSRRARGMEVDDALGRRLALPRRLGGSLRGAALRHARTTRPATTSGRRSLAILLDRHDLEVRIDDDGQDVAAEATPAMVRRSLEQNRELRTAFDRSWPLLDADDLVGDLWTVPAYLRRCAPALDRRAGPSAPARRAGRVDGLGPPPARRGPACGSATRRRPGAGAGATRPAPPSARSGPRSSSTSSRRTTPTCTSCRCCAVRTCGAPSTTTRSATPDPDLLAGPFAHVVVDEAQELTDAEWQMLLNRCPSRSLTIVGDRAQARHGFTESWQERLARIGLDRVDLASLSINYRTPAEVMPEAEPVIRAALPDANVPDLHPRERRARSSTARRPTSTAILETWLAAHADGTACVIGDPDIRGDGARPVADPRSCPRDSSSTSSSSSTRSGFGDGIEGAVDRYVAMTRATQQLVILTSR